MLQALKYHRETDLGRRESWPVYTASGPIRDVATCYSEEAARVLVAAPGLLAAAKAVLPYLHDYILAHGTAEIGCGIHVARDSLRSAIARAEGRA